MKGRKPDLHREVVGAADPRGGGTGVARRGEHAIDVAIVLDGEAQLLQVVHALRPAGGLAGRLDGGEEQCDQHGDDGDDHQQLDESKATALHGTALLSPGFASELGDLNKLRNPAAAAARQGIVAADSDSLSDGRIGGIQVEQDEARCEPWWVGDAMEADVDQIVAEVRAGRSEAYAAIVARLPAGSLADRCPLAGRPGRHGRPRAASVCRRLLPPRPVPAGDRLRGLVAVDRKEPCPREARSAARASRRLEAYRRLLLDRLGDSPEVERQEQALREALRECQEKLPGPAARVLGLRYVECLGFDDIAARVGGSGAAVQRMISRIRLQLRDCIKLKVART